ncbi:hypothetical protein [Streptomyces sp. NPDC058412]|uniref:hypothetical protein n=1 Tax=Streptomyces sp. NPDC058412 TaxID=3346486 RepID=UPI00365F0DD5
MTCSPCTPGRGAHSLLDWEGASASASASASTDDWDAADARYRRAWTFQGPG